MSTNDRIHAEKPLSCGRVSVCSCSRSPFVLCYCTGVSRCACFVFLCLNELLTCTEHGHINTCPQAMKGAMEWSVYLRKYSYINNKIEFLFVDEMKILLNKIVYYSWLWFIPIKYICKKNKHDVLKSFKSAWLLEEVALRLYRN